VRIGVLAGLTAAGAALASGPGLQPAAAWASSGQGPGQIRAQQAEARALESRIQAYGDRVNAMAERYDLERLVVTRTTARLRRVESQVAAARRRVARAQSLVRQVAVSEYVGLGQGSIANPAFQGNGTGPALAQTVLQTGTNPQRQALTRYQAARRALFSEEAAVSRSRAEAEAAAAAASGAAQQARRESARQQALLARVKGRLARLVAAYQGRQAAIRGTKARAAAAEWAAEEGVSQAAQAAQQKAAQEATTQEATAQEATAREAASRAPQERASLPSVRPSAAAMAVRTALAQVGKPYRWGGGGPAGFDCSGLVLYAWAAAGVLLPHYTVAQYQDSFRISPTQLRPGDLVFYDFPGEPRPGHVAMYIGLGEVVVADATGTDVRVESMYYDGVPVGFGRVP
jgi:cell wall-associated NlpC family hydrolase